jgi:hypothetical protein
MRELRQTMARKVLGDDIVRPKENNGLMLTE